MYKRDYSVTKTHTRLHDNSFSGKLNRYDGNTKCMDFI